MLLYLLESPTRPGHGRSPLGGRHTRRRRIEQLITALGMTIEACLRLWRGRPDHDRQGAADIGRRPEPSRRCRRVAPSVRPSCSPGGIGEAAKLEIDYRAQLSPNLLRKMGPLFAGPCDLHSGRFRVRPLRRRGVGGSIAGASPGELRSTCDPYLMRLPGCRPGGNRASVQTRIGAAANYARPLARSVNRPGASRAGPRRAVAGSGRAPSASGPAAASSW